MSTATTNSANDAITITIPAPLALAPDVCPSCGRCRSCGQPAPQVAPPFQPVNPWPWPWIGPIWVAPLTPEQGAPYYSVTSSVAGIG